MGFLADAVATTPFAINIIKGAQERQVALIVDGACQATQYLVSKGHPRIALITNDKLGIRYPAAAGRYEGFKRAMAASASQRTMLGKASAGLSRPSTHSTLGYSSDGSGPNAKAVSKKVKRPWVSKRLSSSLSTP